eukprot:3712164-Prymnesium_polylepis.1
MIDPSYDVGGGGTTTTGQCQVPRAVGSVRALRVPFFAFFPYSSFFLLASTNHVVLARFGGVGWDFVHQQHALGPHQHIFVVVIRAFVHVPHCCSSLPFRKRTLRQGIMS